MILCHDGICHPPSTPSTLSPLRLGSALYSPTVTSAERFSFILVYALRRAVSAPVLPYSKRYTARRISINHRRVVCNPLHSPSLFLPPPSPRAPPNELFAAVVNGKGHLLSSSGQRWQRTGSQRRDRGTSEREAAASAGPEMPC